MARRKKSAPLERLESLTLAHVGVFLVAATWMLGGSPAWAKEILSQWGSLGLLLTLAVILRDGSRRPGNLRPLFWLWPAVLFNGLVLLSCRTPSFREIHAGNNSMLLPIAGLPTWPPTTVVPAESLRGLWLFDVIYLSCFNLLLVVKRRRTLRGLLLFAALNAVILAVFGTLQHFSAATGPFFNSAPTRQSYFFASFIYHNHWGAYALLMTAVCLGLTWHYVQRAGSASFFHTPAFAGLIAVILLAVTEPLSQSRSCVVLIAPLLLTAFLQSLRHLIRRRQELNESVAVPIVGACAAAVLAAAAIWYVSAGDISARLANTRQQLIATHSSSGEISPQATWLYLQGRFTVYRDAWRMARVRLWFGWGMNSFSHVFLQYNTQQFNPVDHLQTTYFEAHNDWIQSVAEHGLVGTTLLGLTALLPLFAGGKRELVRILPLYLFGGCGLILLYAWIEFPFGNTAVVLVWWLVFFAALQYGRLRRSSSGASASPGSSVPALAAENL
jgi:O-antigen ligase